MSLKLFSLDFDLCGTAYIRAETKDEALALFDRELRGNCIDLPEDNFVTGADYAALMDPARHFPVVTMSPAVTVDPDQILDDDCLEQVWPDEEEEPGEPDYVQLAKERYGASDDITVDDDPLMSETDTGAWVQAWVYVSNPEGY